MQRVNAFSTQQIDIFRRQFNWRMLLMRIFINALALLITAILVPKIYIVQATLRNLLFLAVFLGVLNAVIKPIIQFATLRFIFATYGLVVALINAAVLILLAALFPDRFWISGLLGALVGGALIGLVSTFLENLFGLTPPIVSEKHAEIRRMIKDRETRSIKAHVSEVAAKVMLPSTPAEQPDSAASAAAVLAVVDAGDQDPTLTSSPAPSAESTTMQPRAEGETPPPVEQETPVPPPDSSAPAHREG